jgi:hypothetical protein
MKYLMTTINKRFVNLLSHSRVEVQISCNYSDNYYGDKKCHLHRT